MDVIEELDPVIVHDLEQCYIGIQEGDAHLLVVNKPRIEHFISMLSNFAAGVQEEHARNAAFERIEHLQEVRSEINTVLERDNEVVGDVCLSLNIDFATRLRSLGMPWAKIGLIHGVSRQTMYNFRKKHNIGEPNREVDDEELQDLVHRFTSTNPKAGAIYLKGALTASGVRVSINRLKQHLRQANPEGVLLRRRERIYRREFTVPGANFLWCMDSNHKLIGFRMVLHGCIDAFSRKLIYLKIATNNMANTVLQMFQDGVRINGLPKRVRGDRGVENVQVKSFMEVNRPESAHPFIQGRSVHNTRIERLWRETNIHISFPYKALFYYLEEHNLLDEHSEIDLLSLSYVYLPRIQQELDAFVEIWNNHPMFGKYMSGMTPLLAWDINMEQQSSQQSLEDFSSLNMYNINNYGDDYHYSCDHNNYDINCTCDNNGYGEDDDDYYYCDHHDNCDTNYNVSHSTDEPGVIVPEYSLSSREALLGLLYETVPDPLLDDGNHGIELYYHARKVLHDSVQREGDFYH